MEKQYLQNGLNVRLYHCEFVLCVYEFVWV